MNNFEIFCKKILVYSKEKEIFNKAIEEWQVIERKESSILKKCLCTHYPIKNLCYIYNDNTEKTLLVGNCCVKHIGKNEDWFFNNLTKLKNNKRPNIKFIGYLYEKKFINEFEYNFLLNMVNKKKLTEKQRSFLERLIIKIRELLKK